MQNASTLYLATNKGVFVCVRRDDLWNVERGGLDWRHVTCVSARAGAILAGTTAGLYRSDSEGDAWREVSASLGGLHVRWLAHHPDSPELAFAGIEPAGIFVSRDGGEAWRVCPEVAALRDQHGWSLPYSPEAGCIRGFAFHGDRLYAAAEVGGVLRSDDRGEHWQLAEGSDGNPDLDGPPEPYIYPDVHSVEVHASSPDLVFAATGGGFYRSSDGGATWNCIYECYCRAAWVDPANPDHMLLGPADYVDSQGRIEETRDGGRSWKGASTGLPVPWRQHMVERFVQAGSKLFAVLSNGELLAAPLETLVWERILPKVKDVNAIGVMLV